MATRAERWAYWRELVREHAESGLTQAAFCAARGVSRKSLQRWRSKLRKHDEAALLPAVVECQRAAYEFRTGAAKRILVGAAKLFRTGAAKLILRRVSR